MVDQVEDINKKSEIVESDYNKYYEVTKNFKTEDDPGIYLCISP